MFVAALFTRAKWNQLKRLWTDEWMEKIWWCGLLLLSHVRLLVTPWTEACQASLSFTISWSLLKFMSMEEVMPCKHLILCRHTIFHSGSITLHSHKDYCIYVHQWYWCSSGVFSPCPQSFPASGSFPMNQLFTSGGQNLYPPQIYKLRPYCPE